ncbi:DoxX family protein [marine bacterium AO1-C]|nr:DoxX family protein [marine bacterium AO1-C]
MELLVNWLPTHSFVFGLNILKTLIALYFAILFIQSGLDKVMNRAGNLSWLNEYFSKTFLKGQVPLLLLAITITELAAGVFSAIGIVELWAAGGYSFALYGATFAVLSFVMLFFGMRIAQDYDGAASMTNYFTIGVIAVLILSINIPDAMAGFMK